MCTTSGASTGSTALIRHSRSKSYDAAPSAPIVAAAVAVRASACGSAASPTPAAVTWSASTRPRSSSAQLVTKRTGRPSRARATATLAALPPAYSRVVPSAACTMSTRDSPTTRTSEVMACLYHAGAAIVAPWRSSPSTRRAPSRPTSSSACRSPPAPPPATCRPAPGCRRSAPWPTDLELAANTVAKAYRALETDGVISTEGRHGTFIATTRSGLSREATAAAASYVATARRLGLTRTEADPAGGAGLVGRGSAACGSPPAARDCPRALSGWPHDNPMTPETG